MNNSDFPIYIQIMNISMNMGRIGSWVADCYDSKKKLIPKFINETEQFLLDLSYKDISKDFKPTLNKFSSEFKNLKKESITKKNRLFWAERALTWANILQHRAKLA